MLELPFTDPNDYIGVFLLLTGLFLVLAGFGILKIEKITVAKGTRTWFIGLVLTIVGTLFILPPSFITNIPNPDPDHNQKLDNIVNFTKAEDGDFTDFEIRSISAEINGEHLVFTISYDLGANREFVFFDPPAGDIIRHRGDLSANDHETTFEVPISDLAKVDNITINFYTETDPAFVFLEFSDIKRILGNP